MREVEKMLAEMWIFLNKESRSKIILPRSYIPSSSSRLAGDASCVE
jgi:hypothetical protein